ncbi:PaaI family thioesterase [Pelagerythrobacter marensis]|uniref:PaaI family thioesterase n=1 Tax=Pelagerythrobacter marensis TaxID=543877 RepID=A0ABZ2D327_9SPHN
MTREPAISALERELPAYARSLGIAIDAMEDGSPVLVIPFGEIVEGRPTVFHGGATSGLLENAGYAALRAQLAREGREHRLKPINVTVQFLSAAKSKPTYARGRVLRLGRRNAHIEVEAWQDDRSRPVATAVMNVLMAGTGDAGTEA